MRDRALMILLRARRQSQPVPHDERMLADTHQLIGDALGGKNQIDAAGRDGATGHRIVLGRVILREGEPALGFDRLQPQRAVAGRAGQHDADGPLALVLRQRFKKRIDRPMRAARPHTRLELQHALHDAQIRVARNDVDMISLERLIVRDFAYRQRRGARKDLRERALMVRIEMLHQHERHAGAPRQSREQLGEGLQPSGGRSDAHNQQAMAAIVRPVLLLRLDRRMSWADYRGLASLRWTSSGWCAARWHNL